MSEFIQAEARQDYESRRREQLASKEEPQTRPDDMPLADITCTKCSQANPAVHRFCRMCGTSLWKTCSNCGKERPIDEAYCAVCGNNQIEHERQLVHEYQQRLAEIDEMIASHMLGDATLALRTIVSAKLHPCLEEIRATATTLLGQVTAQRDESLQRLSVHKERGLELFDALRYDAAIRELELIPAGLRDEQINEMLAQATGRVQEIARLRHQVQAPSGVSVDERMFSIERLLTLLPQDEQVARWATQARDQLVQIARRKLKNHQYLQAVDLLKNVPTPVVDTTVSGLLRHATELEYLWSEIELAPTISPATLRAAQRLVKLAPSSAHAKSKLQEMLERLQAVRERAPGASVEWTPCPPQTRVGVPVHGCVLPSKLALDDAGVRRTFEDQPGRLFVACGLALQAVNKAFVTANLLPGRNTGVLGALRNSLLGRPATAGWGLDLSASGLKAVRIVVDAEGTPTIVRTACIPHQLPLTHPEATTNRLALLQETLTRFSAEHEVASADRVAVSWPATQSFVRFLHLPPAEGKKGRDMLELESRQQIPMPLDLVARDTFAFPLASYASRFEPVPVLLLAARLKDVEEQLTLFEQAGIDVHAVQCDAVALHNFLHFERLADLPEGMPDVKLVGVSVVDVGADTTNVLFSFRDSLWFRSLRPAANDIVSALVQRFKLTRDVAEEVMRNPAKAKRMSDVHQECCQVFEKLASQIDACFGEFKRSVSRDVVREMLVVGGAGVAPGLLRFLRFGR